MVIELNVLIKKILYQSLISKNKKVDAHKVNHIQQKHIFIFVYLYICIFVYLYICIFVYLYICIFVYLYICIFVYFYICIFLYLYIFIWLINYVTKQGNTILYFIDLFINKLS